MFKLPKWQSVLNFLWTIFEVVVVHCCGGGRVESILDLFGCGDVLRRGRRFNVRGGDLGFRSLRRHFWWMINLVNLGNLGNLDFLVLQTPKWKWNRKEIEMWKIDAESWCHSIEGGQYRKDARTDSYRVCQTAKTVMGENSYGRSLWGWPFMTMIDAFVTHNSFYDGSLYKPDISLI